MFCHANHWIKFTGFIISESRIKILASERRYRHVCTTDFLFENIRNAICIDRADTNEFQCGAHHFAHILNGKWGLKVRQRHIHKYSVPRIKNNLLALTCDRCHSILWIPNIYMDVYIYIHSASKLPTNTSELLLLSHNYDAKFKSIVTEPNHFTGTSVFLSRKRINNTAKKSKNNERTELKQQRWQRPKQELPISETVS